MPVSICWKLSGKFCIENDAVKHAARSAVQQIIAMHCLLSLIAIHRYLDCCLTAATAPAAAIMQKCVISGLCASLHYPVSGRHNQHFAGTECMRSCVPLFSKLEGMCNEVVPADIVGVSINHTVTLQKLSVLI